MSIKNLKGGDGGNKFGKIALEVIAGLAILAVLFFLEYRVWAWGVGVGESNRDITSITNYVQATNYTEATNTTTVYDTTVREKVDVRVVFVTNKIEVKDSE
jgi:hypothetical protein